MPKLGVRAQPELLEMHPDLPLVFTAVIQRMPLKFRMRLRSALSAEALQPNSTGAPGARDAGSPPHQDGVRPNRSKSRPLSWRLRATLPVPDRFRNIAVPKPVGSFV